MIIKGITAQITRTITEKDTAEKVRSGSLPVLATPVLSAAMEEAACKALAPHLTEGETTVGGSISLIHKAPPSGPCDYGHRHGDRGEGEKDFLPHHRCR